MSVIEIRDKTLDNLRFNMPEFIWTTGEPLVDIVDSVADFHYKREFIENLRLILDDISGYRRMMEDDNLRLLMSEILDLSLSKKTKTFIGVPAEITNDVDAFIWFYLDRFAETRGYRRRSGSNAYGRSYLQYPDSYIAGSIDCVFSQGDKLFKCKANLSGDIVRTGFRQVNPMVYSMGFGSRYNSYANTLRLKSVSGTISDINLIQFTHENISNGNDYQTNESFLAELETNLSTAIGLGTRNNLATVITQISTIDKYIIVGSAAGRRFKGSVDIYIKGSNTQIWPINGTIATDGKILIPYQPSTILSISYAGVTLAETTDYTITRTINDYYNSTRENAYIDFALAITAGKLVVGSVVSMSLEVDYDVVRVNAALNNYYSGLNEFARDWLIYKAVPVDVEFTFVVRPKQPLDGVAITSVLETKLNDFLQTLPIENGSDNARLDVTDLINVLYGTIYNGILIVDSFEYIKIARLDTLGNVVDYVENIGSLSIDLGQYWNNYSVTASII